MSIELPFADVELPLKEPEDIAREESLRNRVPTITPLLFPEIWAAIFTMAAPTASVYRRLCTTSRMIWHYCWLSPSSRAYFLLNKKGHSQAVTYTCMMQNHKLMGPDIGRVLEIMMPKIPEINCDHDFKRTCPMDVFAGLRRKEAGKRSLLALLSHPKKNLAPDHIRQALRTAVRNNRPVIFKLLLLGEPPTTTLATDEDWLANPNENDITVMNEQLDSIQFGLLDMNHLLTESKLAMAEFAITHNLRRTPVTPQGFSKLCDMKRPDLIAFMFKHRLLDDDVDPWTVVFMDDVGLVTSLMNLGITPTPIALVRTACSPRKVLQPVTVHRYIENLAMDNWGKKEALFGDVSESSRQITLELLLGTKFEDADFALALAGAVAAGDVGLVEIILVVALNVDRSGAANIALFKGDYDMGKVLLETCPQFLKFEPLSDMYRPAWPNQQDDTERFLRQHEEFKGLNVYTDANIQSSFDHLAGEVSDTKQLDVFLSRTTVKITNNTFYHAINMNVTNVEYLLTRSDKWNMSDEAKKDVLEDTIHTIRWTDNEDPLFDQLSRMIVELGFPLSRYCVSYAASQRVRYGNVVDESRVRMVLAAFGGQTTRDEKTRFLHEEIILNFSNPWSANEEVCFVFKILHESGFEFDSETLSLVQGGFPQDPELVLFVSDNLIA